MFKSRSWFFSSSSNTLWKPKNPHSLDYLKYLHGVLTKNLTVTEGNKGLLVEALRSIAEILIWGDQNDPGVFDFFLEKNMLSFFLKIMKQNKCGSYVCVQLLQTLNILFENIKNQTSIYYLLSNNHVNSIIEHKFDFSDEEVMAYYISFLKTLSLKLNSQTIHFFYNEHTNDFPLYTEAIKFFNNSESMVRIAVRTLTLNVFRVDDKSMQKFVTDKTAAPYFSNLVWFINNNVLEIDKLIKVCGNDDTLEKNPNPSLLSNLLSSHLDHSHYINDILALGIEDLNDILIKHLLSDLIRPVIILSLLPTSDVSRQPKISRVLSLYLLTQTFMIINNDTLLAQVLLSMNDIEDCFLSFLDCAETDYLAFFAVSLYRAVWKRLKSGNISVETRLTNMLLKEPSFIIQKLIILLSSSVKSNKIRIVTVSLATDVLLELSPTLSEPERATVEDFRSENMATLQTSFKAEDMFLELFEDEFQQKVAMTTKTSFDQLLGDSSMLLPPVASPLSGIALEKRRPCGETERIRRNMRIFFVLRELSLKLQNLDEKLLPLSNIHRNVVKVDDVLDLTNSDLFSCTFINLGTKEKIRRFLVVDEVQMLLVEPSVGRMGWGVVNLTWYLQDIDINFDHTDPRALQINLRCGQTQRSGKNSPVVSARFVFDDHIRCMAATQRLTRGRARARDAKLSLISRLLQNTPANAKYSPPQNLKSFNNLKQHARYTTIAKTLPGVVMATTSSSPGSKPMKKLVSKKKPEPDQTESDGDIPLEPTNLKASSSNQSSNSSSNSSSSIALETRRSGEVATTSFTIDKDSVFDV